MSTLNALNLALFLACFISFSWAIKCFFTTDQESRTGMQAIKILGGILTLVHLAALLFYNNSSGLYQIVGLAMYLLSLLTFWWAIKANKAKPLSLAYSLDEPQHLVNHGPYAHVRHPFYTSYLFFWVAGAFASQQWLLLLGVAVMFYLYFQAASLEENKFINSPLKAQYQNYQQQTGMFLPSPFKRGKP